MPNKSLWFGLALSVLTLSTAAFAEDSSGAFPWEGHWQMTVIPQGHGSFPAAYSGPNSLRDETEIDTSVTSTFFLGSRLLPDLEIYLDPEMNGGSGLSGTLGVAGFPNGEIFRVADPALQVGLARAFLQWTLPLTRETEHVDSAQNQIAEDRAVSRFVIVAGKFSLPDYFDQNAYSHDARNQFLNLALMDMGAWDFAADVRGYTNGMYLELDWRRWALRFAEVQEPTTANGGTLDNDIARARSENLEADVPWLLGGRPGVARWIAFCNHADMGSYKAALDQADSTPLISETRVPGSQKYGFGLNLEQEIADGTGLFARASWNDGTTETWAFTEIDQSASLGAQLAGTPWNRKNDTIGIAAVINGISAEHQDYLAAGGCGFILGDGALDYAPEQILELYYDYTPLKGFSLTPDYQYIKNPAYNQARGPVSIYALRLHYEI
jgi:high affinity Mn2+ porin